MTARRSTGPMTRIYLVERIEALAHRIEVSLRGKDNKVGFERGVSVVSAARDLAFIDPDVVVINVDEMKASEWNTLAKLREAYPDLRFFGLSDNPDASLPPTQDVCDGYFPVVHSIDQLKQELSTPRVC